MVTIYLALMLPPGSSNQPGDWAGRPLRPSIWSCSGWGLPSRLITQPLVSSYLTISPLPALTTILITTLIISLNIPFCLVASRWRYVSVALSVGSPLLGVTQHPARWSSDFPPA